MIYAQTHNSNWRAIQAFDTIDDYRAAEEDGWRLIRLSRREVETELGRMWIFSAS
jgi:hypothetical protein